MSPPVTCGSGSVCERLAPAQCADPGWAEWPISNSSTDVSLGAPNLESYADHGDGTVPCTPASEFYSTSMDGNAVAISFVTGTTDTSFPRQEAQLAIRCVH